MYSHHVNTRYSRLLPHHFDGSLVAADTLEARVATDGPVPRVYICREPVLYLQP